MLGYVIAGAAALAKQIEKSLLLTPRQIEILTILALCPHGLTLEHLYQALYGE
jgi:hypothetical protein